jgi:predicted dehydrogenase
MSMTFGLLGTGYWATETHAAGLVAAPDARFAGVWGRDPVKAKALADRYGVRAYPDVDGLLADVDAVAIALPPQVQAGLAVRAAAAGKHLLLDKPIALSMPDADALLAAVTGNGVASVVFVTNRYVPAIEETLRDAVAAGGWHSGRTTMHASIFRPGNPYAGSAWRREKGGLWDVGPHALSLLLPVLGPVVEVSTVNRPHQTSEVTMRHGTGASSTMSLSLDVPPEAVAHQTIFEGTGGSVVLPRPGIDRVDALATAAGELIRAAATPTRAHACDVRFGWEITAILVAAEQSARTATPVPVPHRPT